MPFHIVDMKNVPGYPFKVPPPFPSPQLRTLIPTSFPNNGTYKMIEASAVPQLNNLFRPQVSLGCAWDPIRKRWTISSENQNLHWKMVDNFKYGVGSLLRDYLELAQGKCDVKRTHLDNAQSNCETKTADTYVKRSLKSNLGQKDTKIITIQESESEDEDEFLIELKISEDKSVREDGLLAILSVEEDLLEKILIDLDVLSLKRMESTCSSFRNLIDSKNIWQKLSDRKSQSDKVFNFESNKKLALTSNSRKPLRIDHKKTLLQFERSGDNLREGFGYLRECSEVKRGERWDDIVCSEQFIAQVFENSIWVTDRVGKAEVRFHLPNEWNVSVIGFVNNILLVYNHDQSLIGLLQISTDGESIDGAKMEDSFIGPILGGVKGMHLAKKYLAICTHRGKIQMYNITGQPYQALCEVVIPLGHTVPCRDLLDWSGIEVGGGEVFVSLHKVSKNEVQHFHNNKLEGKVMTSDLTGKNTGFIHGLLDPAEGIASLKYADGFLYVITKERIRVWNHDKKELISSKRFDVTPKSCPSSGFNPCMDISVELSDNFLIIVCGKVLSTWDRRECEKVPDYLIQKYDSGSNTQSAFAKNIMSGSDRSLLWKVMLPFEPTGILIEAWRITLLPRYQTECLMILDFWC